MTGRVVLSVVSPVVSELGLGLVSGLGLELGLELELVSGWEMSGSEVVLPLGQVSGEIAG